LCDERDSLKRGSGKTRPQTEEDESPCADASAALPVSRGERRATPDDRRCGDDRGVTLDPSDWEALRALGHRMVDDMLDTLACVRTRPVWQPVPAEVLARLQGPAPRTGAGADAAYADFVPDVLPFPLGNIHPRFWGWVMGAGTPVGMLAELLAAGLNPNVGGRDHVANDVEAQVLAWLKELLGYPPQASGLLVSGTSMANLIGLTVARNARAEIDVRRQGLAGLPRPMTVYASAETHGSVRRAVELLGLGWDALRIIACTSSFRIDLAALARTIASDRAAGCLPMCVVGSAGTVNTGAIDDLSGLADLCAREGLWFHVDGAFGALAALSPALRPLLNGMERADSLGFDLHKWFSAPYDVGCILVRDEAVHRAAFAAPQAYLERFERGVGAGDRWATDYGPELSRGFRALKLWMTLKTYGADAFGHQVEKNVAQAHYLATLIDAAPDLERLAPVPLNVVCFRYAGGNLGGTALDALNRELLMRLQESGRAVLSSTAIDGRFALRAAIVNHRSLHADFEVLVDEVRRLGHDLLAE
jgi:aromatic-L-amino-acid decarboxylase